MKTAFYTLIVPILLLFGCTNDDDSFSLSSNLHKLKSIVHIDRDRTNQENFYYGEGGKLQVIENFRGYGRTYFLKYTDGTLTQYGNWKITYDFFGRIKKEELFESNNSNSIVTLTKEYQHGNNGKIVAQKQYYSEEFLSQIPELYLPGYGQVDMLIFWENGNVKEWNIM